jgi:integrase
VVIKTEDEREELQNLRLVLSSPRPRSPDTISGYILVARQFLDFLGDKVPPSEMDLRRFIQERRNAGLIENTLRTYFASLKKFYQANHWEWPFTDDDRPESPSETESKSFTREEIEQLIANREKYTKRECFYLAIATVYAPRRIELARIEKKYIKGNTIYVDTAKKGEKRTHLIPDEIMPYIEAFRPMVHSASSMSAMINRICKKGLGKDMKGYGWHSFRYSLDTLLPVALAKADKPLTYIGYFLRWSRRSTGTKLMGASMAGYYTNPDILSSDPFYIDREVLEVHPFLKLWVD